MRGAKLLPHRTMCGGRTCCCRVHVHVTKDLRVYGELLVAIVDPNGNLRPASATEAELAYLQAKMLGWLWFLNSGVEVRVVWTEKKLKKTLTLLSKARKKSKGVETTSTARTTK